MLWKFVEFADSAISPIFVWEDVIFKFPLIKIFKSISVALVSAPETIAEESVRFISVESSELSPIASLSPLLSTARYMFKPSIVRPDSVEVKSGELKISPTSSPS